MDRRCLINNEQASGVLVGHLEGVTFIDSRGDGRYLISNGKDQTIKLWDIRKMSSNLSQYVFYLSSTPLHMFDFLFKDYYLRAHILFKASLLA